MFLRQDFLFYWFYAWESTMMGSNHCDPLRKLDAVFKIPKNFLDPAWGKFSTRFVLPRTEVPTLKPRFSVIIIVNYFKVALVRLKTRQFYQKQ